MSGGELFRIGEVARLFHLSVSTLRHYERLGLVTPERVDPDTGYRYYSARQFEALNTVRYLRALDMPLEEISDFVHNRDLDNIQAKLRQQRETVARKRAELERVQRKIDARLEQLEEARHCELDHIRLVEAAPCRIVWVGGALTIRDYHDMELPVSRLSRDEEEAVVFLGKVGLGLSVQALERGEFDRYDGIFLVLDRADRFAGETVDLPGGRCAQVHFRGSHREAPAQYRRLMDFLAGEGLRPAGFAREITMIDYGVTDDPSQFVTEITVPVEG